MNQNEKAQAQGGGEATFAEWLATEMPAGTIIGDPAWWADRIARQYAKRCAPPSAPVGVGGLGDVFNLVRACESAVRRLGWRSSDYSLGHEARMLAQDYENGAFKTARETLNSLTRQTAHPPGTPMMPPGRFHDALWKSLPAGVQHHARMLTQSWATADSTELKNALEAAILSLARQPAAVDGAMVERVAISIYAAARGFSAEVAREKWPSVEQKSRFTGPARAALGQETTND